MNAGSAEIELKFLCEPADLAAVLSAAPSGETVEKDLVSTYFDTPQADLKAKRVSLRIREGGGKTIQTLKRGDGFAREEHEQAVDGALDLSMAALKEALPSSKRRALRPAFTVRVQRQQRTFDYEGATIEMAVDRGEVQAGDRRRAISEVELELKSGDCGPLFELARRLSRTAPLYLSFEGKSAQGQMLSEGLEHAPRHHASAPLSAALDAAGAFQAIARGALAQIAANGVVLREADSVEAVHQLRVAVRRLRSALSTFKPILADERAADFQAELKWLAGAFDEARDLDVFAQGAAELAQEGADLSDLVPAVEKARQRGHAKAAAAVASGRFRDLVLDTTAWIETGDWLTADAAAGPRETPARDFAAKALDHRRKVLLKRARRLKDRSDAERHKARIAAKKLRYAAEAFAPLFDGAAAKAFIKRLKRLQDELGALNDAVVAEALVARLDLDGKGRKAADALLGARKVKKGKTLRAAAKAMEKLADTPAFWRG
jgi:inorganic triphosphatase YgiF